MQLHHGGSDQTGSLRRRCREIAFLSVDLLCIHNRRIAVCRVKLRSKHTALRIIGFTCLNGGAENERPENDGQSAGVWKSINQFISQLCKKKNNGRQ